MAHGDNVLNISIVVMRPLPYYTIKVLHDDLRQQRSNSRTSCFLSSVVNSKCIIPLDRAVSHLRTL